MSSIGFKLIPTFDKIILSYLILCPTFTTDFSSSIFFKIGKHFFKSKFLNLLSEFKLCLNGK